MNDTDAALLAKIEAVMREHVPDAKCELWDYDSKVRCGVMRGDLVEISFSLRSLYDDHIRQRAEQFAAQVEQALNR